MQSMIKRFWFVILVGVMFLFAIGYYVVEQTKDILKGKKVDGHDVVFELNGEDFTADDLYHELLDNLGIAAAYSLVEKAVVLQGEPLTTDQKSEAKIQTELTIEQFKQNYPTDYEDVLSQALIAVGYESASDLQAYFEHLIKLDDMTLSYLLENEDEFITPFIENFKPRMVSHILVAMDNPDQPTEEEQSRWDKIKNALAAGQAFGEVAAEYSDDTGSATNNGALGYMDAQTNFVEEFLNAALKLDEANELSEWVKSDYGYHLIQLDSLDLGTIKKEDGFKNSLLSAHAKEQQIMIWEKAKTMGLQFTGKGMENLQEKIENYINPEGGQ
ncbi:MAG: hypothetical protein GX845_02355 [Erysipelothrix sp.]|jgi:foldase protein PrsA|nr:hypothetical protein [Erysipelothrix sp.]